MAIAEFAVHVGRVSTDEYDKLREQVEQLRELSTEAGNAFDTHINEHSCYSTHRT
jgi:hypothetical protein